MYPWLPKIFLYSQGMLTIAGIILITTHHEITRKFKLERNLSHPTRFSGVRPTTFKVKHEQTHKVHRITYHYKDYNHNESINDYISTFIVPFKKQNKKHIDKQQQQQKLRVFISRQFDFGENLENHFPKRFF